MKKKLPLLFVLSLYAFSGFAQFAYNVSSIPESLKTGASVVKRLEEISFEVTDLDKARYTAHRVVTILNKEGEKALLFSQFTNKYIGLEECEIRVINEAGLLLSKYKKKDMSRQAADGSSLISEGVYYYIAIAAPSYPITLDIYYELHYTGTLNYPDYTVQEKDESVEQSSFTLKVLKEIGVRFKEQRISLKPDVTDDGKMLTYKWSAKNIAAIRAEKGAASDGSTDPSVLIAPNKFKLYGSIGDMSTWKTFGLWESDLIKDRDVLSEERKLFLNELVRNVSSDKEKVALVYKYLQQNFRYVSIQLGIGGYQPFPAKFTDEKKYGDCKALSFYMYSALKAIGIRSHVALINARYDQEPVDPSFPQNRFNHMILCVPQRNDSIWLECTSRTSDFNYLGNFTENRYALLITENGGMLVPTPASKLSMNRVSVCTKVALNEDGSGQTVTTIKATGDMREMLEDQLISKADDKKSFIVNTLGFKQPDEFKFDKVAGDAFEIDLAIEKIPQFKAGAKMFINPRICSFWSTVMPSATTRRNSYFFRGVEDKTDSTVYQLPAGYTAEVLPKAVNASCTYADYSTMYTYDKEKNQVVGVAHLVLYKNCIPADKYTEVKNFFDMVLSDDSQKIVINKN